MTSRSIFTNSYFETIIEDLLRIVEDSRINGKLIVAFNMTFLALILKTVNPSSFDHFQLISLCNAIYKIITKTIGKRLKHFSFVRYFTRSVWLAS